MKKTTREQRRRASKRNAPINDLTAMDWLAIQEEQSGICFYCLQAKALTQDHMIPLSRGGSHTRSNIVGACQSCNSKKNTKTTDEFVAIGGAWSI